MAQQETTRAAIWARVSTEDQHAANQLGELREWAERRGVEVVAEFITEDSAWSKGNGNGNGNGNGGGKGAEFDRKRRELLEGARLRRFEVVLIWGLDRLSRRGAEDMLGYTRRLAETGCRIWSLKDPWCESLADPMTRELLLAVFATIARFESERRSERTKAGMARAKAEGKRLGGRKAGAKDKAPRQRDGYSAAWTPERRAALAERNRARAQSGEAKDS
jgi:DNA invertase Pin-like site-specific DNA recombinase